MPTRLICTDKACALAFPVRDGVPVLAVGAPGGRRIMDTCLQMTLDVVDFGLDIQSACAAPLIDCAGPTLLADDRQNATGPDRDLRRDQLGGQPSGRPGRTGGPWHDTNYGGGRRAVKATGRCLPALLVAKRSSPLPLV